MSKKIIEKNRQTILQQIFIYVTTANVTSKLKSLSPSRQPHIIEKIKVNFNKNQKFVNRTFYNLLPYINLVKQFIENQMAIDSTSVCILVDRVQSLFLKYRKAADPNIAINDFQFFDRIAEDLTPDNKKDDVEFISMAKATVLYIFEMCDIGKPPDNVAKPIPLTQGSLFDKE